MRKAIWLRNPSSRKDESAAAQQRLRHPLPHHAQSRAMEEALRKLNIPYRIYGGLSFYKRKEIKDLLAISG